MQEMQIFHCSEKEHCHLLGKAKIHKQVTTSKETFLWVTNNNRERSLRSHFSSALPHGSVIQTSACWRQLFWEAAFNYWRSQALYELLCIRSCSKGKAGFQTLFPVLMEWFKPDRMWREKQLMNSNNQHWVTVAAETPNTLMLQGYRAQKAFLTFRVMVTPWKIRQSPKINVQVWKCTEKALNMQVTLTIWVPTHAPFAGLWKPQVPKSTPRFLPKSPKLHFLEHPLALLLFFFEEKLHQNNPLSIFK